MRIFYKPLSLKAVLSLLTILGISLANLTSVSAQVVQVGAYPPATGTTLTSGYPNPYPDANLGSRQQYLFLASELKAAGMNAGKITSIQFHIQNGISRNIGHYKITGGMTSATSLSNSSWASHAGITAYEVGPSPAMGTPVVASTWAPVMAFSTPIPWDGVQNLIIELCVEQVDGLTNTNPVVTTRTTSFNSTHSSASNVTTACGVTNLATQGTQTLRPIVRFNHIPNCIVPDSINIDNITAFSADLSWPASSIDPSFIRAYNWMFWEKDKTMPATYNGSVPSKLTHDLDFLKPETCYYVRLRTDCLYKGAATDSSDWILDSFCTIADCVPPTVTVDRITSTTAVGSWTPVPTAYDYEYATSVLQTPPTSGIRTTSTAVQLLGLKPSQYWYLYVRAYCDQTPISRWTRVEFKTLMGLGFDDVANGFALSAYPNPVKDIMTIQVVNPSENASVMVTDLTGKLVRTVAISGDKAELDMSGLNAGMYLVKYTDRLHSQMIKITKE